MDILFYISKMYECNCNAKFKQLNNRYRHQKKCTNGEVIKPPKPDLKCSNSCGKSFGKRSNLNRHMEVCKDINNKTIHKCTAPFCEKNFISASKLERHHRSHEEKPLFVCNGCSATYTRADKFEFHKQVCADGDYAAYHFPDVSHAENDCDADGVGVSGGGDYADDTAGVPEVYIIDEGSLYIDYNTFDNNCQSVYAKIEFAGDVADCTIKYLKLLKHESKRSNVKLQEFAKLFLLLFNKKFDDLDFMVYLARQLGFCNVDELKDFLNLDKISEHFNRGSVG